MGFVGEFKEFIAKGNVIDLAVGVVIGGAFGAVVKSFVEDVVMPPIGAITGGINFSDKFYSLDGKVYATLAEAKKASAPVIGYGAFINNVINFLIVALVIFVAVRVINKMRREQVAAPAAPTRDQELLMEIRDSLRTRTA